jgi:hypothetical protein
MRTAGLGAIWRQAQARPEQAQTHATDRRSKAFVPSSDTGIDRRAF